MVKRLVEPTCSNLKLYSVQFSSFAESCPTPWPHELQHARPSCPSPTPGVYSTHVLRVCDTIQPSHPLSSPSCPAPNPSQHQSLFQWVNSSHEVAKVLEFQLQHQAFQWCKELTHWKRPWCWERLNAGGEGNDRGWGGGMASLTEWTWVWVRSGSWWWTGRPGVLQTMGSLRVGHNCATELNQVWVKNLVLFAHHIPKMVLGEAEVTGFSTCRELYRSWIYWNLRKMTQASF